MRVTLAYISVILLWATTPLAIKWSGQGPGFLFAATSRMVIGSFCMLLLLLCLRKNLAWHKRAIRTYLAVAMQIYGAMYSVYWAAQFIPSGWLSVIFGLTPLVTAIFSALWLHDRSLTPGKSLAYALGISGLFIMFGSAFKFGPDAVLGIFGVLMAVLLQAASAVCVKRINAGLPAVTQVAGGLLFALPAYLLNWWFADGVWPEIIPDHSLISIVYLGVVATPIGFALYYYVLTHLSATRVSLITLISPVMALLIGYVFNHEALTLRIVMGAVLILLALIVHEFFERQKTLQQA